jgi:hypothetical protein
LDNQSVRQMQGVVDLLRDGTVAASDRISKAHAQTACVPYAILKSIPLVRVPAERIESIQSCITVVVYQSVRAISTLSAFAAAQAISASENRTAG